MQSLNHASLPIHIFCYFLCVDTVRKEAATITAVFPTPNEVMAILVQVTGTDNLDTVVLTQPMDKLYQLFVYFTQRVLEQRVTGILDKILAKPSLMSPPPVQEGGLLLVCRYLFISFFCYLRSRIGIRKLTLNFCL